MVNVALTQKQLRFIEDKVRSGRYRTAADVVREGVRLLMRREWAQRRYEAWREDARRKIQEGLEQLERGEYLDGEEVFRELQERIDAHRKKNRRKPPRKTRP